MRPDGASRAVAYVEIILAERLENPFDEAGNCYILYGLTKEHMKADFLILQTSDNILYSQLFLPPQLLFCGGFCVIIVGDCI